MSELLNRMGAAARGGPFPRRGDRRRKEPRAGSYGPGPARPAGGCLAANRRDTEAAAANG